MTHPHFTVADLHDVGQTNLSDTQLSQELLGMVSTAMGGDILKAQVILVAHKDNGDVECKRVWVDNESDVVNERTLVVRDNVEVTSPVYRELSTALDAHTQVDEDMLQVHLGDVNSGTLLTFKKKEVNEDAW